MSDTAHLRDRRSPGVLFCITGSGRSGDKAAGSCLGYTAFPFSRKENYDAETQ